MQSLGVNEVDRRFGYHPPLSKRRVEEHEHVRSTLRVVATDLDATLPDGREKELAIERLEEAMFWANASLARAPDLNAEVSPEDAAAGPKER